MNEFKNPFRNADELFGEEINISSKLKELPEVVKDELIKKKIDLSGKYYKYKIVIQAVNDKLYEKTHKYLKGFELLEGSEDTIGVMFGVAKIEEITCCLWFLNNKEFFNNLYNSYCMGAHLGIIIGDKRYNKTKDLIHEMRKEISIVKTTPNPENIIELLNDSIYELIEKS